MKILPVMCAALVLGAVTARGAVDVTVVRIEESRGVTLVDDHVSRPAAEMTVIVSLTGPEAEAAVHYGGMKIEEATDDTGASLLPTKKSFGNDAKLKDFANAFFRKSNYGSTGKTPAPPQVNITLATAKRSATKIAHLKGSFTVATAGTMQTVELADLTGGAQKTVPVPEAAHVGIKAKAAANNPREINVEITGDESAVESLEVVDATGKSVSYGMSSTSINGGPVQRSLDLNKPLDATMKVVAKIAMDRQVTKVPFDLKDIALP